MLTKRPGAYLAAWQGSARAANQARLGEDFTGGGSGGTRSNPTWAASTRVSSATKCITAAQPHHDHLGEAQQAPGSGRRGVELSSNSEAEAERDRASDLLGEEAADESIWRRWKRT
jgi:hypothetical protein